MLQELGTIVKFFNVFLRKKNPTDWPTYLKLMALWAPFVDAIAKASSMPLIGRALTPMMRKGVMDYTWIPINKRLEVPESKVLPLDVLKELVAKSAHRVIARQCPCRQGFACEHYPKDLGCIYLGEATKDFDPALAIHATVDEALAHIDKAVGVGLVPDVGQIDFDADLFGVKPKSHFATICFCCDCCCAPRRHSTTFCQEYRDRQFKLEGVSVKVKTADCTGCGICKDRCFMGAISIEDKKAAIDETKCRGCGVCVEQCPKDAIKIEVTDGERMRKAFFERIESRVDLYSSIPGKEVNKKPRARIPHPRHGLKIPKYKHSREPQKEDKKAERAGSN